jgi:lipopolysaccharide export system protein LptA
MRYRSITSCFSALFALLTGVLVVRAQDIGPSAPITLQHADSFVRRSENGQEVIELIGHVQAIQGVVNIRADKVVLYPATNRATLTGNVVVSQPGMTMTAPVAEYDGNSRTATAPSGVRLQEDDATLTAGSGTYRMYERIAYFNRGVTLQDPQGTLRAGSGEYYSLERRAIFRDGVTALSDSGKLVARQITYWRDTEEAFATGNVVLTPKAFAAVLSGDTLHNIPARSYTLVLGSPKLTQIDTVITDSAQGTVRRDTTTITARKMEAFRSDREEYVATDSVRLVRGDLMAVARLARFFPKEDVIALGGGKPAGTGAVEGTGGTPQGGAVTGRKGETDSTALAATPRAVPPEMYPVVWYDKSQLTGDTITIGLEDRRLRVVDVVGNAFAVSKGNSAERFDQLAGSRLLFNVERDTIRSIQSEGLASSIYFLLDGSAPNGVNRASGDTILISFARGTVSRIFIHGKQTRAEGEYFPEPLVTGRESTFRLQGFRWIPREAVFGRPALSSAAGMSNVPVPAAGSGELR